MAWQYPIHACGHEGERYQAYGKHTDRERQLAARERHDCPACRAAAAQNRLPELPALVGTEKQVAWASEMRLAALSDRVATLAAAGIEDNLIPYALKALSIAQRQTKAKWWIDNRPFGNWLRERIAQMVREEQIAAHIASETV